MICSKTISARQITLRSKSQKVPGSKKSNSSKHTPKIDVPQNIFRHEDYEKTHCNDKRDRHDPGLGQNGGRFPNRVVLKMCRPRNLDRAKCIGSFWSYDLAGKWRNSYQRYGHLLPLARKRNR